MKDSPDTSKHALIQIVSDSATVLAAATLYVYVTAFACVQAFIAYFHFSGLWFNPSMFQIFNAIELEAIMAAMMALPTVAAVVFATNQLFRQAAYARIGIWIFASLILLAASRYEFVRLNPRLPIWLFGLPLAFLDGCMLYFSRKLDDGKVIAHQIAAAMFLAFLPAVLAQFSRVEAAEQLNAAKKSCGVTILFSDGTRSLIYSDKKLQAVTDSTTQPYILQDP